MKRLVLVSILIAIAPFLAAGQAVRVDEHTGANPLVGTWKANLEKSQRHPNHLFQSMTLRITVSGDVVSLAYTGINMGGQEESGTQTFHVDGKEYPIIEAPGVIATARWIGKNTLETVAKKNGNVVGQGAYEVSGDGKTLTARVKGIDASGASFQQVIVLDRSK